MVIVRVFSNFQNGLGKNCLVGIRFSFFSGHGMTCLPSLQASPKLIERFKEREENVKVLIWYSCLSFY